MLRVGSSDEALSASLNTSSRTHVKVPVKPVWEPPDLLGDAVETGQGLGRGEGGHYPRLTSLQEVGA